MRKSGLYAERPMAVTRIAARKAMENKVPTVSRCPFSSPAPLYWAAATVPPIVRPIQTELIIKPAIEALLIAASPVFPTILPTTSISTML